MFVFPQNWYPPPYLEEKGIGMVEECFSRSVVLEPSCFGRRKDSIMF